MQPGRRPAIGLSRSVRITVPSCGMPVVDEPSRILPGADEWRLFGDWSPSGDRFTPCGFDRTSVFVTERRELKCSHLAARIMDRICPVFSGWRTIDYNIP